MYNPAAFKEERVPVLHQLIRDHPLATLVVLGPGGLVANHVPMLVDADPGPLGTLRAHVARANPLWQTLSPEVQALAVFQGPEGYITPSWYRAKAESGKVVPTWNYAVVHAHGPLRAIEDQEWLRRLVGDLTDSRERGRPGPWHVTDAPDDYIARQLGSIVGLEMRLTRLEGKWKMSQNRPAADRAGVVQGLRDAGDAASRDLADLVAGQSAAADAPPLRRSAEERAP